MPPVTVLIPVLNDWEAVRQLLMWMGRVADEGGQDGQSTPPGVGQSGPGGPAAPSPQPGLSAQPGTVGQPGLSAQPGTVTGRGMPGAEAGKPDRPWQGLHVLLLDDGSDDPAPRDLANGVGPGVAEVTALRLLRNVGHQRAIAIGLAYVSQQRPGHAVLIMDGDGEDKPDDIPRLLREARDRGWRRIVFAERTRRSEGWFFKAGYLGFRVLHRLLTGKGVRYGNFSVVPPGLTSRLAVTSELWNHYAAAVTAGRIPFVTLPTIRGRRLAGRSKMNLPALVTHGLSALSVHGELVATRFLLLTSVVSLLAVAIAAAVAGQALFTDWPIPGWTSQLGTLALVLLMQAATLSVMVSALALLGRSGATFIPARDYTYFIGEATMLRSHFESEPHLTRSE